MILNVSGRCDIVGFYMKWFMNRYHDGFIDVRNPFNPKLVSRIFFEDVDAILFCTKNPIPILSYLKEIEEPIVFHVTLTPYKNDVEPGVPSKKEIINTLKKISDIIGIDNLYIRYDPIFLSSKYNLEYHKKSFDKLCKMLNGYVKHIIISFIDDYKNVRKNMKYLNFRDFEEGDYEQIGLSFSKSARENGISVQTCFEDRNLIEYGFVKDDCLSANLAFKLTGKTNFKKWTARKGKKCNCVEMVDIGTYNCCQHFCRYCYANYDEAKVKSNYSLHDMSSSLLIGHLSKDDIIKVRKK